jgi:biotin transport system substrate-specific component
VFFEIFGMILGSLLVYILGVSWLKILTGMEWAGAVKAGMLPFLPGDLIKIAAAVPVAKALRPIITDTD